MQQPVIEYFAGIKLSPQQAETLSLAFSEEMLVERNGFFQQAGSVCKKLAFVAEGMLRYYYVTEHGEEVTRWVSLKNSFATSLSSFITQSASEEYIQAIRPSRLLAISKENWDRLYENEAFVRDLWVKAVEANYIGMETRVFNLISKNAQQRYDWVRAHQPLFITEVPDKYLASMLGIKPRHLSRLRAKK